MTEDIKIYSLAKDGGKKVGKYFRVREFACHDGSDVVKISPGTIRMLDAIREFYGYPVTINSGYRTPAHNRKIGGAKASRHVVGDAADFVVRIPRGGIVSPAQVFADIDKGRIPGIDPKKIGLESYRSFTHLDSRGTKARWRG